MIIDIFTHVFPQPVLERMEAISPTFGWMGPRIRNMRDLYELDRRFRVMDEAGEYVQIISLASPPLEEVASGETAAELARIANDAMAELVERHRDRFPGFVASVSLDDVDSGLAEIHRAVGELGARGVQLFTDVDGKPLDDPAYDPVFGTMAALGRPIWLHPTRSPELADFSGEDESRFDLWLVLGWPYATAATMIRLVVSGLFDRHPGIRILTHHMGGMIPFHETRIEGAMARMAAADSGEGGDRPYMRRAPLEQLKAFYADTAMHGALEARRCGMAFFGANNSVFATDHPFGSIRRGLDMVERLELDDRARQKLVRGNAERFMGGPPIGGPAG